MKNDTETTETTTENTSSSLSIFGQTIGEPANQWSQRVSYGFVTIELARWPAGATDGNSSYIATAFWRGTNNVISVGDWKGSAQEALDVIQSNIASMIKEQNVMLSISFSLS
jgi:hypothetical protein